MDDVNQDARRARDAFEQGWPRVPKTPAVLSEAERSLAWDLLAKCRGSHRFDGAASVAVRPLLLFRVSDKRTALAARRWLSAGATGADPSAFIAYPYGWPGTFGGLMTVTAVLRLEGAGGPVPRVCIAPTDPVFQHLRAGRFVAVFASGDGLLGAREVDFAADPGCESFFREQWENVSNHQPDLPDDAAQWWEVLDTIGIYGAHLSAADKLSVGWVKKYRREVRVFTSMLQDMHSGMPIASAEGLPPTIAPLHEAIATSAGTVAPVIASIHRLQHDNPKAVAGIISSLHAMPDAAVGEEVGVREIASAAVLLRLMASDMTGCGRQLPCLDGYGMIRPLDIEPARFRKTFPPEDYWPRKPRSLHLHWRKYIGGGDTPADSAVGSSHLQRFPVVENPEEAETSADALLDEAVEEKKWTIPPGATVELAFGPFTRVNVFEHGSEVGFVAKTADGDFTIFNVEPRQHYFACDDLENLPPERATAVAAAVKLLLSAVIRDFWVLEQRESVFGHRRAGGREAAKERAKADPTVVYLPRIQYTPRPRLDECSSQLDYRERREHMVRAHLRRADRASAHQVILARRYNFDVPAGYTFVRPHQRGSGHRDVIYRSRSAIRSLYDTISVSAQAGPTEWFRFESDVRRLLEAMGFQVQHVAASTRGDQGIDIYATKDAEPDQENWIIYCRHCRGSRKVPPRAARDLADALAAYPAGTRGMMVTDSNFSPGAASAARQRGIRLVDGSEMSRMLGG